MITSEKQISKTRLNSILEHFHLQGNVTHLQVTPAHTYGKSKVFHLSVSYQGQSQTPEKLFLKLLDHSKAYLFNLKMAREMESPPLIPLYAADFDDAIGKGYLLMADLSDSHFQTEWPLPPSLADCKTAIDVLARFHAHWWQHPRLEKDIAEWVIERRWQNRLIETAGRIDEYLAFLGDRLSDQRQKIYRLLANKWPEIVKLRQRDRPQTVTHGDAHAWNFLFPKDAQVNQTVLFDWTNWDISTGTDDLAYMIGLHWYPNRRASHEEQLIRRYYQCLKSYGVSNYSWEECWNDYRRSILRAMLIPVWQWEVGISPSVWWPHLERGHLAFDDLIGHLD